MRQDAYILRDIIWMVLVVALFVALAWMTQGCAMDSHKQQVGAFEVWWPSPPTARKSRLAQDAINETADQFRQWHPNPHDSICCAPLRQDGGGTVIIQIHNDKPEAYGQRVVEYSEPEVSSHLWIDKVFSSKRGLRYTSGKHFAHGIFERPYQAVRYDPSDQQWVKR